MEPIDRPNDLTVDPALGTVEEVPPEGLRCPKCRYVVYGLRAPRCPECGESFSWEEARAAGRRLRGDLFEDRWYDAPVTSLGSRSGVH